MKAVKTYERNSNSGRKDFSPYKIRIIRAVCKNNDRIEKERVEYQIKLHFEYK